MGFSKKNSLHKCLPWGEDPEREADIIAHWITDIDLMMSRLEVLRQVLQSVLLQRAKGEDTRNLMDYAWKLVKNMVSKSTSMYNAFRLRIKVNEGSLTQTAGR